MSEQLCPYEGRNDTTPGYRCSNCTALQAMIVRDLTVAVREPENTFVLSGGTQPVGVCNRCGRNTWSSERGGEICAIPQPCGHLCGGRLVPSEASPDLVQDHPCQQ